MTERRVREILRTLGGTAAPRPGFKEELGERLVAELEDEEEPDARQILRHIVGPVSLRPGFRDELRESLTGELVSAGARSQALQDRRGLVGRLKNGWWLSSAAAVVALTVIASGTAWTNCLQSIGVDEQRIAAPGVPVEGATDPTAPDEVLPGEASAPAAGQTSGQGGSPAGERGGTAGVLAPPSDTGDPAPAESPGEEAQASQEEETGSGAPPVPAAEPPQTLAFASRTSDGYWHIFTMNGDGTNRVQLTEGSYHDREPEWSPDGKRIAFMRLENPGDHYDNSSIYVMNADGSGLRFLAEGAEPVWSPDGRRIAYAGPSTRFPLSQASTVWTIEADGSDPRPLDLPGATAEPAWSSRGNLISFAGILTDNDPTAQSTNIFAARPDGSAIRRLTSNAYACNMNISPDGSRIVYVAVTDSPFDLWVMNVDGSEKTRLTSGPEFDFYPHWSPGGKRIVFGRDPDGEPHWSPGGVAAGPAPGAIWEIKADGSGLHRISPPGVDDADPAYRPARRKSQGSRDR